MTTMVIDRAMLPEPLFSFFNVPRIAIQRRRNSANVTLKPVIDPDDYANDAEYLAAIPGMMDSIMASINSPKEEWERVPRECFNV